MKLSEMTLKVFDLHACAVGGRFRINIRKKHIEHSEPTGDVSHMDIL